jgi:glycogen debranching enzyme
LTIAADRAAELAGPGGDQRARLARAAREALGHNWREGRYRDGTPYAFTCPSAPRYRHQWYWDSCFHAIAWARFDPPRAREELRTLLRAGRLDGFVPHTVFWDRPARWRRAPFYGTHTMFGDRATATTQTPLLAMAWELVADASVDEPGFRTEAVGQLALHHDWLEHERDPDGDGLLTIIHPDESGLDDSPKYDDVFGWMRHDSPGYFWLIERCRRMGYDARRIVARYDEHVEDVLVNVAYALSSRALARMSGDERHARRAERTEASLLERCWDERRGLFWDLAGRSERTVVVSTWSSLAPLALPSLPEAIGRRMVEEHLLDARRYAARCGIPSVSMDEPRFRPGFDRWRTWRGPSWVNTAWFLVPAMRRLGYADPAERVVAGLVAAWERGGFREYYHPHTGRGLAARNFGWSTLLAELAPAS